jgi:2-hydroxy-3-keto-5-methylthiopentenyl-1-phosphate phosphatase
MIEPEIADDILDGFQFADERRLSAKISRFIKDGKEALHIVSDFDLTLTSGKIAGQNLGTWDVMDELIPPEGVARHTKIYNSFRPIERAGKLTAEVAAQKWAETLDLITSYPINIDDVRAAFLAVANLRDGAKSLFDLCEESSVPTVILSSGIRNVVQVMVDHYDIHPAFILSNDLIIDETTRMVNGWRKDSLVHILNKNEMGHDELNALRRSRHNVILIGDVPDDTKMVEGDDVIRIRILDPRKGETFELENALSESFTAGFDLTIENSLEPVVRLVKYLCKE